MTDDNHVIERAGWAPVRHFAERSLLGLLAVVAAGLGFGALLLLVRTNWSPLRRLDQSIAEGMNGLVAPHEGVVKVITTITSLGGRNVLISVVVMAAAWLLIRRRPRLAIYLAVTGLGALVLDPSLKALVGRVRPVVDDPVAFGGGNSFPSGHTLGTTIVYGALALVLLSATRGRWKGWILTAAALIIVLVGLTRIALSVHFLSDVLAGWLLGLAWISITAYAFRVWRRETGHVTPPVTDGLEPEAADDLKPAPAEGPVLPHPWAKGAEILVSWVFTFGVLYFLGYAVTRWNPPFDDAVPRWLQTFRTERLDHLSWLASKAGDTHAILLICLVVGPLALALWRQWRPIVFLVLTMAGEITLFLTSAAAVGRPRPAAEQLDGQMPTSSFPSGHIAATMCVWVAIAVVAMPRVRQWWRWIFPALAVVMPLLVATSRMYRGMHHPTDVLGALLLTACWVGALYVIVRPDAHAETVSEAAHEAQEVAQRRPVAA
ncbi:phosphatase PAP2 family protein [Actinoplanes bogorensis]|uniref:Phosphatase PAP2 family protein n=1 Tax=Paractinoplanes bogorensis TaxID=1610840 RepID=A0ABS5YUB5_9ACTN|nr:phosphatase PAP2 family protein [Actinoplanes bogorensis]MBU2666288.1 phosphatase PAP2 family protein [Actinoplanes bogorensis]